MFVILTGICCTRQNQTSKLDCLKLTLKNSVKENSEEDTQCQKLNVQLGLNRGPSLTPQLKNSRGPWTDWV